MFKFLSCFDARMCYCTQISDNLETLDQLVEQRQIMHKCTELYMILLCYASYVDASRKLVCVFLAKLVTIGPNVKTSSWALVCFGENCMIKQIMHICINKASLCNSITCLKTNSNCEPIGVWQQLNIRILPDIFNALLVPIQNIS